jgi:large subunit ribosomal protein L23
MALFGSKKTTKTAKTTKKAKAEAAPAAPVAASGADFSHIIRHARITEKATMHSQNGVYVFNVAETAGKREIIAAVKKIFSVTPRKVSIVTVPSKTKRSMRTGRVGTKAGGKKAYVYLAKGETLNI